MKHLRAISRTPHPAQDAGLSLAENVVLFLLTVFFRDWHNFEPAISGLRKFYMKTPS